MGVSHLLGAVGLGALALGAGVDARAPFQCASDRDPERRLEDSPAEALWDLAERFEVDGNTGARETTLRQLVERYPDSSEAQMARMALTEEAETSQR